MHQEFSVLSGSPCLRRGRREGEGWLGAGVSFERQPVDRSYWLDVKDEDDRWATEFEKNARPRRRRQRDSRTREQPKFRVARLNIGDAREKTGQHIVSGGKSSAARLPRKQRQAAGQANDRSAVGDVWAKSVVPRDLDMFLGIHER